MIRKRFLTCLGSLLLTAGLPATTVLAAVTTLPPGLYRIESQAEMNQSDGPVQLEQRRDAGGAVTERVTTGNRQSERVYQGSQRTYCAQPAAAGVVRLPPGLEEAGCTPQSTRATADGWIHVAECRGNRTTLTAHRIDDDTWEFENEITITAQSGMPDMASLRPTLENMARNGTPEQRAKASRALASLPQMQAQMADKRADALAGLAKARANAKSPAEAAMIDRNMRAIAQGGNGQATRHATRERWTRIASSCAVPER